MLLALSSLHLYLYLLPHRSLSVLWKCLNVYQEVFGALSLLHFALMVRVCCQLQLQLPFNLADPLAGICLAQRSLIQSLDPTNRVNRASNLAPALVACRSLVERSPFLEIIRAFNVPLARLVRPQCPCIARTVLPHRGPCSARLVGQVI